jgi:hypothetical protein
VNSTGWLKGLQVTAGGAGVVTHAGLPLACAIADGGEAISDFRVLGDQGGTCMRDGRGGFWLEVETSSAQYLYAAATGNL